MISYCFSAPSGSPGVEELPGEADPRLEDLLRVRGAGQHRAKEGRLLSIAEGVSHRVRLSGDLREEGRHLRVLSG
jgi:hypothetical protein